MSSFNDGGVEVPYVYTGPVRPITLRELLTMEIRPRLVLIDPWLPQGGLAMIYAARGIGKTYLALSIAYALSTGQSLLGWQCEKSVPVLYIDGEMPLGDLRGRLDRIRRGAGGETLSDENLRILAADMSRDGIPDLATEAGQRLILDNLGDARVVILDNVSTLLGIRENEADDWGPVQRFMLHLRRRGISVIIIHHAGRSGQARGTSRREDVLDTVITLTRPDDYVETQGARFEIRFEKSRGFTGESAATFEATLIDDRTTEMISWTRSAPSDRHSRALEIFANKGTAKDVMDQLEVPKSTAYKWYQAFKSGS